MNMRLSSSSRIAAKLFHGKHPAASRAEAGGRDRPPGKALHGLQHRRFLFRQRSFQAGVEAVENGHWFMLCAPSITMVSPVR